MTPVLVEYPRKGAWALAFMTQSDASGLKSDKGEDVGQGKCTLFVPTTPNPTSGYFIFVNQKDVVRLDIGHEDAIKLLMSAGVVFPKLNTI